MVLKHHTLSPFDRKPQGAVAAGGQVRLRVTAEGDQTPLELFLRVWNGAERRYPMRSLGVRNGKPVYEAQIGVAIRPICCGIGLRARQEKGAWCLARRATIPDAAKA